MKKDNNLQNTLSSTVLDPNLMQFELMKHAYIKSIKDDFETEKNNQDSQFGNPVDRYIDDISLDFANVWVEAYSKSTGQSTQNSRAFDNYITPMDFDRGIQIAKMMRGETLTKFAERITIEFGTDNPTAAETIIYFISDPRINQMFQINCNGTTPQHAAEIIGDKIRGENTAEELKRMRDQYWGTPILQTEEQLVEQKMEETPQEVKMTDFGIQQILAKDFGEASAERMEDYYANLDFDGENVIIITPDGDRVILDNPDPKTYKMAIIKDLWKFSNFSPEPDASEERLAEIDANLFRGENKIVFDTICRMLAHEQNNSLDAIMKRIINNEGIQSEESIQRAYEFLVSMAQYGDLELDFQGQLSKKGYIEMVQEKQPVLEFEYPNK